MSLKIAELRYSRDEVALLLGVKPHNIQRIVKNRPGFPAALPGTYPPLWSRRAVDAWFNTDAGRLVARDGGAELTERITVETEDEVEADRRKLHAEYGGR